MRRFREARAVLSTMALVLVLVACNGDVDTSEPDTAAPDEAEEVTEGEPSLAEDPEAEEEPRERATVRVGILGVIADAQFYVADELGYFDEQDIDVEFTTFSSGADVLPTVAGGEVDVAWTSFSAGLYNAVGRGIPVTFVAGNGKINEMTTSAMIAGSRTEIDPDGDISQLEGRPVAVNGMGVSPHAYLHMALTDAGMSIEDVDLQILGFADQLGALGQGAVDAALPVDPLVAIAERQGLGQTWMTYYELAGEREHDSSLVVYSPEFAEQEDVGTRFMAAYLQGSRLVWQGFTDGDEEAREQVIDVLMDRVEAVEDRSLYDDVYTSGGEPNGEFDRETIDLFFDAYQELGLIELDADEIDFDAVIDMSFVERALQDIGPYEGP